MRGGTCRRLLGMAIPTTVLLIAACTTTPASEVPFVREVIDGDTLLVHIAGADHTVRLLGVDTPETSDPNRPEQCFGAEATAFVESLIPPGTPIRLERDIEARDRYGRLLAYVYRAEDGVFVNAELLIGGYADLVIYAPNETHRAALTDAYTTAVTREAGLWGACGGADVAIDPPLPSA